MRPRDILSISEVEEIDRVCASLRKLAHATPDAYWIQVTVRSDGRVEFRCEDGTGTTIWVVRGDLHPDSSDQMPSAALCDVEWSNG